MHEVNVIFRNTSARTLQFTGSIDVLQFSGQQYQLSSDRDNPYPIKSEGPAIFTLPKTPTINLPPYSLTIIRGPVSADVMK